MSEEYLKKLNSIGQLKIVVIGQDPYPIGATDIAFCKSTFSELFYVNGRYRCSGQDVLYSCGLKQNIIEKNNSIFKTPKDVFLYLLENGIAFLNISYQLLDAPFEPGQPSCEFNSKLFRQNEKSILKAKHYNEIFLKKTDKIILLGKLRTLPIFKKYYTEFKNFESIIHPSNYNKKDSREEWIKYYKSYYILNKIKNEKMHS